MRPLDFTSKLSAGRHFVHQPARTRNCYTTSGTAQAADTMSKPGAQRAIDEMNEGYDDSFFPQERYKRNRRAGHSRDGVLRRDREVERKKRSKALRTVQPYDAPGNASTDAFAGIKQHDVADANEADGGAEVGDGSSPPEYDKLKPQPPPLDPDDVGLGDGKKKSYSKEAQQMIEYLQEQNRALSAEKESLRMENEHLRKQNKEDHEARDCFLCPRWAKAKKADDARMFKQKTEI